jgi:hypothetical protein
MRYIQMNLICQTHDLARLFNFLVMDKKQVNVSRAAQQGLFTQQ